MLMSLENKVGKIREIIIPKYSVYINHERFSRAIEKYLKHTPTHNYQECLSENHFQTFHTRCLAKCPDLAREKCPPFGGMRCNLR